MNFTILVESIIFCNISIAFSKEHSIVVNRSSDTGQLKQPSASTNWL